MHKLKGLIILATLILFGCAPTLRMSKEDLSSIGPGEGLVFGSLIIKAEKPAEGDSPGLSKTLDKTKWYIKIENHKDSPVKKFLSPFGGKSITAIANGAEVPFIAKLPAGRYQFENLVENGWGATLEGYMRASFNVGSGQNLYIGRLVLTLPNHSNPYWMGVGVAIEDAEEETIALLKDEYGDLLSKTSKELMVEGY